MPRWFPRADNSEGISKALLVGCMGAIVFAGMDAYVTVASISQLEQFNSDSRLGLEIAFLIVGISLTLIALVAAWRFAIGKGLVWGSVVLLLLLLALVGYFLRTHTTANAGGMIARFAVAAALIVGLRGAWAARTIGPEADYAEVFE
jgi:hypothetical protein